MINYQNLFNGIVFLLEKSSRKAQNPIIKQCLEDCDLELAFTPANKETTVLKDVLLDIYKRTDDKAYEQVSESFNNSNVSNILIWYIDTNKGGYSIFTNKECDELIGIKTSEKTLNDIRKGFFKQKETLEKMGEKPAFDYSENEITFVNKILMK